MKRLSAPGFWSVKRKENKFVIEPQPGPHPKKRCIPLGIILRDILKYAENMKEVRSGLNMKLVKINSRVVRSPRFPVGLMDVVSVSSENYRVLTNRKGLCLHKIDEQEAGIRLAKIIKKTCVKGKVQLNLHDGNNILLEKNNYNTGDVLVLENNKVKDVIKFEKGALAMVTGGSNIGNIGNIENVVVRKSSQENHVELVIGKKKTPVPEKYVFVVGKDKPVISLGETNE